MSDLFSGIGMAAAGVAGAVGDWLSNERNVGLQQETNAQNERLMRESWAREDTAVQRRVADLEAAGMSPILAAGQGAAAGAPVRMEAPRVNATGGTQAAQAVMAGIQGMYNIAQTQAQTEYVRAQSERAKVETERTGLDVSYLQRTLEDRVNQVIQATTQSQLMTQIRNFDVTIADMRARSAGAESLARMIEARVKAAFLAGSDFVEIPLMTDGVEEVVRVDVRSARNPLQQEAVIKSLTAELLQLEKRWFVPGKVKDLVVGAANVLR